MHIIDILNTKISCDAETRSSGCTGMFYGYFVQFVLLSHFCWSAAQLLNVTKGEQKNRKMVLVPVVVAVGSHPLS